MSLSYVPLKPILVVPNDQKVVTAVGYGVLQSAEQVSFKAFTCNAISPSSLSWSCPPPSGQIILSKTVWCVLPIRLTFTAQVISTNAAFTAMVTPLNAGMDAPRCFPSLGSIQSLKLMICNDAYDMPLADVIHPLSHYNICSGIRTKDFSSTPNMTDNAQSYSQTVGSTRNPLGGYLNGINEVDENRGAFAFTIVQNDIVMSSVSPGSTATAIVDFVDVFPLICSPLGWNSDPEGNLYNVTSFDVTMDMLNTATRFWSHNGTAIKVNGGGVFPINSVITSVTAQFNDFATPFSYPQNIPQLLFKYITPNLLSRSNLGPNIPVVYPFTSFQSLYTQIGLLPHNTPRIFSSNVFLFNQIPKRIFLLGRPDNNALYSSTTLSDAYLAIRNVNIQWQNQSTILSTANINELFNINRRNGSDMSFSQFSGANMPNSAFLGTMGAGVVTGQCSPLCLEFGRDIQCSSDQAPSLGIGQYQIQCNVTFENLNADLDTTNFTFLMIVQFEGCATIIGTNQMTHRLGVLTHQDILNSQTQPGVGFRDNERGGDFLGSLGNLISGTNNFLKDTKAISTIGSLIPHPIAQGIGSVAKVLGYGEDEYNEGGRRKRGGCHGEMGVGGAVIQGGARMSKQDIRRHLM